MSGIGPVEPYGTAPAGRPAGSAAASGAEVIGTPKPPRTGAGWHPAWRRTALGLCAFLAVVLAIGYVNDRRTARPPPPTPGLITRISYEGPAGPPDLKSRTFTFRIKITVTDRTPGSRLLVQSIRQPYPALTTFTTPTPPFTVRPGTGTPAVLKITVDTCTGVPHGISLPLLEVTLRNGRTGENTSYSLGATYAADLEHTLATLCPVSAPRSPQAP
jgi:hypothetical protein